jgi:hypothetical protein
MKPHRKKKHYEEMMVRMTKAIEAGFYLEAIWYAYAILEDRMIAILHRSGGAHDKKKKLFQYFGHKLNIINNRRKQDSLLRVYFPDASIAALTSWKDKRNDLMHAMANAAIPLTDIDKQAHLLAQDGKTLVKDTCRCARLLGRNRHQVSIPMTPFPY